MIAHAITGSPLWNLRVERQTCRNEAVAESVETSAAEAKFDEKRRAVLADRKSTRLNSVTNAHLVCRLLLEKSSAIKETHTLYSAMHRRCPTISHNSEPTISRAKEHASKH